MRDRLFFPRLALVNLARNGRFYGPYLLACGTAAAMFYILRYLAWSDVVRAVRGAPYLQAMLSLGCGVAAVFSGVILLYAHSFVMKRRQRELGLYNVLGLDKGHLAQMCFWETALCAAVSIGGGIGGGVLLSRGMLWLLLELVRVPAACAFTVSGRGAAETAALFAILFALTLAKDLLRLGRARPVELLRSGETGEREPKTKKLLTALGLLALSAGYAIALTTHDVAMALMLFFLAVLLVMLGTYCLFTAGSVALLKGLRRNRRYYYQTRHFTAVSGLLYRMRRNAVGLANICILSTMVLVTVSATLCLYLGIGDVLDARTVSEGLNTAARQDIAEDYYAMYGGFLFVGLFLGALFLLATVLIICYKQVSEGYEDQRRFAIMERVGMTRWEVADSVRSQVLLVFFLPLGAAGLHTAMAFPMLCRMLEAFQLYNVKLFARCTAGTLLAFCAVYILTFAHTARTYGRIVGGACQSPRMP